MSTRLYVANISATTAESDLRAVFGKFGAVDSIQIAKDAQTGRSRGYAIVAMVHDDDATSAISRLNFTQYGGRTIGVSRAGLRNA